MNSVDLTGRLTRDPELRSIETKEGPTVVCDMRMAVDNGPRRRTTYVDVATFGKAAEACAEHLSKGRLIGVTGALDYGEWEAEDGSKRSKHSVIGRVEFLGKPTSSSADNGSDRESEPAAVGAADEDIPF